MRQKHLRAKRTLGNDPRHCTTRYRCTRMLGAKKSRELTREGSRQEEQAGRRVVVPNDFQIDPECPEGERNKDVGETTALCRRNCPGPHRDEYILCRGQSGRTRGGMDDATSGARWGTPVGRPQLWQTPSKCGCVTSSERY